MVRLLPQKRKSSSVLAHSLARLLFQYYFSILMISAPPMNVPMELPIDDKIKTSSTRSMRFLYQPFIDVVSSCRFSMSETFGLQINACTMPVTMPTPTTGVSDVKGAETRATIAVTK